MSLQRELRRACGSARGSDGRDADRLGDVRRSAVGECRCNTNDLPRVLLDEGCPVEPGPRPGAEPDHEQLVESEAGGLVDPVVVGLEQSFPVADDGVVHGVPVTPELCSHFVHAAGVLAHLSGRPPSSPGGEELSRSGDPVVLFGPAAHRTVTVRAHPPALPPHQPARTTCSGRSTSSTRVRSFTWASTPHDGQPADRATVSTWIFATPPGPSSTPRKVMSGSPIIHSSARLGSVSTGVLHLRSSNNQRLVDPRYAPADPAARPRSIPKCLFDTITASPGNPNGWHQVQECRPADSARVTSDWRRTGRGH